MLLMKAVPTGLDKLWKLISDDLTSVKISLKNDYIYSIFVRVYELIPIKNPKILPKRNLKTLKKII